MANNKFFWANGEKLVGTLNTDALEQDATATPDKIIQDFTAWVTGEKITGTIPTILRMEQNLEAGQSYTIPYGLSYGTTIYLIFLDIMKLPFETFCLEGNLINETLGFL